MKKKIILMSSLVLAIVLIPVVLICFAFGLAPQYDKSFYGGMKIKYERLRTVEQKKIVIIGGSSVAFGVRSDIMEEELGMPVINFGLYANLGTKVMLDIADDYINDGDIVIISPEQNHQALSLYFNGEATWYMADGCFGILTDISRENAVDMAKSFLKFTSGKFGYMKNGNKPDPDGIYNVKSFNDYGDIEYERRYNVMKNGYDTATPISFNSDVIDDDFIEYMNAFRSKAKKKGATVYYSFCPMNSLALDGNSTDDVIKTYYDHLRERLDFAVIGNPKTHLMDSNWFYDSNFHLNTAGAVYYTTILSQELKAEINDFTYIKTEVPEMPEVHEEGGSEGAISDDLEVAAKVFELGGVTLSTENGSAVFSGTWTINSLTEYGKTLAEIVIPDTLCGVPVTAIASECFKDNTIVTKITLGKSIESVGKGVFSGCSSLTAIYVTSDNPDAFHVPADILDGLDNCYFFVPEMVFTEYMFDYFWSYVHSTHPLKTYYID